MNEVTGSAIYRRYFFLLLLQVSGFGGFAQGHFQIDGVVIDDEKNQAIPYANVYIKDTFIGTVTNSVGAFSILIPEIHLDKSLVISSISYTSQTVPISTIDSSIDELKVRLKSASIVLNEVEVANCNLILEEALSRVAKNYPSEYTNLTSFYRELIKKNRSYVDISQGVLNIAKTPYISNVANTKKAKKAEDIISVSKGHRITRYSRDDTLAFKVKGGPSMMMMLDIVKHPGIILGPDHNEHYQYDFEGINIIDGRRTYVLSFTPKAELDVFLYQGLIYIDEKSFAIAGLSFRFQDEVLKEAGKTLVTHKPALAELTLQKLNYDVRYRQADGVWFLDYVRNEIEMKVNWKKRLFNSQFNATTELVVTNKGALDQSEFDFDKLLVSSNRDLFSDQISDLIATEYWQDFSIIKPEEDLKKAIDKIVNN